MDYREYLRTPEWRQIRAAGAVRAGDCCSLDVPTRRPRGPSPRQRRVRAPRTQLASDLIVLCRACPWRPQGPRPARATGSGPPSRPVQTGPPCTRRRRRAPARRRRLPAAPAGSLALAAPSLRRTSPRPPLTTRVGPLADVPALAIVRGRRPRPRGRARARRGAARRPATLSRTCPSTPPRSSPACAPPARSSPRRSARMRRAVRPGITTAELDAIARREFARAGARSARSWTTASRARRASASTTRPSTASPAAAGCGAGDLVKLDVTAELDGFYADACRTVVVGGGKPQAIKLVRTAEQALAEALKVVARRRAAQRRSARPCSASSRRAASRSATGSWATASAAASTRRPTCPTSSSPQLSQPLPDGLVITIEPLVAAGGPAVRMGRDGWTVSTADRSLSAHAEHTIVVRDGAPLVLTA